MTVKQLLKPRYKVIADYPLNPWLVNEILFVSEKGELIGKTTGFPDYDYMIMENEAQKYPHLFRKLHWWEERDVIELPGYVKIVSLMGIVLDCQKVKGWSGCGRV